MLTEFMKKGASFSKHHRFLRGLEESFYFSPHVCIRKFDNYISQKRDYWQYGSSEKKKKTKGNGRAIKRRERKDRRDEQTACSQEEVDAREGILWACGRLVRGASLLRRPSRSSRPMPGSGNFFAPPVPDRIGEWHKQ
ncbi:hypothetical protein EJB05_39754, partial [Eragrostis curvula]